MEAQRVGRSQTKGLRSVFSTGIRSSGCRQQHADNAREQRLRRCRLKECMRTLMHQECRRSGLGPEFSAVDVGAQRSG
eukprot:3702049-Rhodomonas_salina.3